MFHVGQWKVKEDEISVRKNPQMRRESVEASKIDIYNIVKRSMSHDVGDNSITYFVKYKSAPEAQ